MGYFRGVKYTYKKELHSGALLLKKIGVVANCRFFNNEVHFFTGVDRKQFKSKFS